MVNTTQDNINPLYLAYCRAHDVYDIEEMRRRDYRLYPGGSATGFMLWMSKVKQKFRQVNPDAFFDGTHDIGDYDAWYKFVIEEQHEPL